MPVKEKIAASSIFWFLGIRNEGLDEIENCTACVHAYQSLRFRLRKTEKSILRDAKQPGEELQLDLTVKFHFEEINGNPQSLVVVDHFSK